MTHRQHGAGPALHAEPAEKIRCLAQRAAAAVALEVGGPWTAETQPDPCGGIDVMLLPQDAERFSTFVIHWSGAWVLAQCRDDSYRRCCTRRSLAELLAELRQSLHAEMASEAARAA